MRVDLVEVDSKVFGRPMLSLSGFEANADFRAFEEDYVARYQPAYVTAKLRMDELEALHELEAAGFRFMECQIRSALRLRQPYPADFPYRLEAVESEEALEPVLDIAAKTFVHDRFANDLGLPKGFSGERYRAYVRHSYEQANEAVYRLIEEETGATVGFKTHRYVSSSEGLLLLGGVAPECKNAGVGVINEYLEFNELRRKGIQRVLTHFSAANHAILQLEIGRLGFRVESTLAVLRKIYG